MIDIRKQLNSSQWAAVTTINGPVLVIAGAGSGKTRVIEYRVLYLVQNNIDPGSILLLTFTRKAAREMLGRATVHDPRCQQVEGGTFHSFAYKLLRRHGPVIGLSRTFTVLDEDDAEQMIRRCCVQMGLAEKKGKFPKKDTLKNIISMSLNKDVPITEVLDREYPHFIEYAAEIEELREKYAAHKKEAACLDYDDLLIYLRLLLDNQDIRGRLMDKHRFVMVDEYQDTNKLQGEIACLLAQARGNIMAVGDDAQSIYGFRGAFHENIMQFPDKFPECNIIKLEENYRSTQSILDTADMVLENMANKYSKCLVSARNLSGHKPQLLVFRNVYEEALWITDKIEQLRDAGINLNHQAVLFRSSHISISLQAELSKRGIAYQVFGGLKFYETAHVKDLTAYLKVTVNPKDLIAWNRALTQIEGIGVKTSERMLVQINKCENFENVLNNVLKKYSQGYKYSPDVAKLRSILKTITATDADIARQFEIALEHYKTVLKNKFDNWPARLTDLESIKQIAARYDSLADLLADFAIDGTETSSWDKSAPGAGQENSLTLSTIHSAKGLEWEAVFLIGLIDGILPVRFVLNKDEEIEEEHRLFYVALTRAKSQLFLSLYQEGSRDRRNQFNNMSRFLDDPGVLSKLDCVGPILPGRYQDT